MCTVSWRYQRQGYEVFFSRDELRTRRPALPPCRGQTNGIAFLAPRDGDAGGTWLATNALGLTIGLLNLYQAHPPPPPVPNRACTRGQIPIELAGAANPAKAAARLHALDLSRFQPFSVLLFSPDQAPLGWQWDGCGLRPMPPSELAMPITSSSLDGEAARRVRLAAFQRCHRQAAPTAASLLRFHRSHYPRRGPFTVCMHRADAATSSLSHVTVTPDHTRFRYWDGPPCQAGKPASAILGRNRP